MFQSFEYHKAGSPVQYTSSVDEIIAISADKLSVYDINEIVRLLETLNNKYEIQVIVRSCISNIYIEFTQNEYIKFGIQPTDLDKILKYITQVSDPKDCTAVFSAPNLQVISYDYITHDEYLDSGLHVVFGYRSNYPDYMHNLEWLDDIPSMYSITINEEVFYGIVEGIIERLPKWPTLQVIRFKNQELHPKLFSKLQTFIRLYGVYTNYPKLRSESEYSCDLVGSVIWMILSSKILPIELLRLVVEMLGF